ncbi:MAG: hypothetical protein IKZ92_05710 [Muribaculaceae bacterium]|nr:hypothetical protein [Muribaculaceae bacterium]
MKKSFILAAIAVIMAVASAYAQQIAVVSEGGETSVYQTFQAAIEGADPGSVIYLPGGGFPIADSVKITKKLTIIGIGHKSNNDNVDGFTTISGNLWFNEGSSGSAILGCYITGDVNIGEGGASVNNVMVKCCNLNSVQVKNSTCMSTFVNQSFIRSTSEFGGSNPTISNNVLYTIGGVNGGKLYNNIVMGNYYLHVIAVSNSVINYNVFFRCRGGATNNGFCLGGGNQGTDNIFPYSSNEYASFDNKIILGPDDSWNVVFVNYVGGINPMSDFHFSEAFQQYSYIGIYGGTGFNDHQTAPVPYIVAKRIDQETDAAGQLKIQVRVKAGE